MPTDTASTLALDVGTVRIGLALASAATTLPRPLATLANDDSFLAQLEQLITDENVSQLVVGLPRGLDGQETDQTGYVRDFTDTLSAQFQLPIAFQDEALSSSRAKAELTARNKPFVKGDIDALAATYILEDYLTENRK